MSEMIQQSLTALPVPSIAMSVRAGTRDDIAFMDALQKKHSKALGFFPRAQMEGYIDAGNVLIALDSATGERIGYVASKDRYLKRDELGAIFQMCVAPGHERKFIAANLLREVFERSSYGCRLYCCWCAQDLPANRFWEAMGFVPIAYRAGSATKGKNGTARVHIFWQKRIRSGDNSTPYWFPAKTEGGAIREDRIILPIPPGMRWTDELPLLLNPEPARADPLALPGKSEGAPKPEKKTARVVLGALIQFAPVEPVKEKKPRVQRERVKADPAVIAKARELRDKWMEHVNHQSLTLSADTGDALPPGKYDVSRSVSGRAQAVHRLAA